MFGIIIIDLWKTLLKCLNDNRGSFSLTGGSDGASNDGDVGGDGGSNPEPLAEVQDTSSGSISVTGHESKPSDFLSGLDAEVAGDPSLKVFKGEDGKFNVQNLIKSYVHAQKKIGERGINVPDKFATAEDWEHYYNQLRPSDLTKYEIKAKEAKEQVLDEAMFNDFKVSAHKLGLTTKQAQEMYNWYDGSIRNAVEGQQKQASQQYEEEVAGLKKEWGEGDSFKKEMNLAQRAINEFADDSMKDLIKKAGLDQNITMIKLFNKIGKSLMQEDVFTQESHGHFGHSKAEAERKIAQIYGDKNHAYWDDQHPEHKYAVEEVNKLYTVGQ